MARTEYPGCCDPHYGYPGFPYDGFCYGYKYAKCCYPAFCTGNCYSDTCTIYQLACAGNSYSFGTDLVATDTILAVHVNDLQDAIDDERFTRRGLSKDFTGQNVVANVDAVLETDLEGLRDSINQIIAAYTGSYNPAQSPPTSQISTNYPTTKTILASDINELRASINLVRQDCACFSDCGSNSICSCDGNCGCYYSDIRLKKEVVYFV